MCIMFQQLTTMDNSNSSNNNNSHDSNNEEKEENDDDVNTGQDDLGVDDWLIIPMVPLDRFTMKSVLGHIAVTGDTIAITADNRMSLSSTLSSTSSSVLLTESATNRVLDALEWHQWIHKTTGEVLRIWSPNGTRPLLQLWKDEILDIIGKECHHNHPTATVQRKQILDFEETPMEQFVMRSCVEVISDSSNNDNDSVDNNNNNNNKFNDDYYNDRDFIITTIDHRTWDCRRLIDKDNDGGDLIQHASSDITCRFYL
mmetsp:Transcript_49093/g.49877  ORF Transcript_49093/g.49877 Transcript_49093/m.49877 type:complete len:257 (+) Transcript_49093:316-1086(+)